MNPPAGSRSLLYLRAALQVKWSSLQRSIYPLWVRDCTLPEPLRPGRQIHCLAAIMGSLLFSLSVLASPGPLLFYPVANTNTFVPTNGIGFPHPDVHFHAFQSPAISGLGGPNSFGVSLIAFDGMDENDNEGLYLWIGGSGGTLRPVVTVSDLLPGFNENYAGGLAGSLSISGTAVHFWATTGNLQPNQTGLPEAGLYSSVNGAISKIADTCDSIPGGSGAFIQFDEVHPDGVTHYFIGRGTNDDGIYTPS